MFKKPGLRPVHGISFSTMLLLAIIPQPPPLLSVLKAHVLHAPTLFYQNSSDLS